MTGKCLIVFFFTWALLFFHSCMPLGDQRRILALSRADNDIVKTYTDDYRKPLLSSMKICPHCKKIVDAEISVGECMFREWMELDPESPDYREKALALRCQLQGESESGYGPASFLLGIMAEYGAPGFSRDTIKAARYYRMFAESGDPRGNAELAAFWVRLGIYLPEASQMLENAIRNDPRNTEYGICLSQAYTLQGEHVKAFEAIKRSYYYSPVGSGERAYIESLFLKKLMYAADRLGEEKAMAQIHDMVYLSPKNTAFRCMRIHLYLHFHKQEEAKKELSALKDQIPERQFRLMQVQICTETGDFQTAHVLIKSLLQENPLDFSVRKVHFLLSVAEGREKEAFDTASLYIRNDADNVPAYLFRASLYMERNRLPEAIQDYSAAAELAQGEDRKQIERMIHSLQNAQFKENLLEP